MKRKEDPHDALLLFFNPPRPYLLLFHPSLMISKCIDPCEFVLDGREHPSATRVLKTSAVNHLAKCTSAILKEPNVAKFLASLHFLYFSRSLFLICRLSRRFFHKWMFRTFSLSLLRHHRTSVSLPLFGIIRVNTIFIRQLVYVRQHLFSTTAHLTESSDGRHVCPFQLFGVVVFLRQNFQSERVKECADSVTFLPFV